MRLFFWIFLLCASHTAHAEITPLTFNASQQAFLDQLDKIHLCEDPDLMPYDGVDRQGNYTGIMSDFHQLRSAKMSKPIRLIKTKICQPSLKYIQQQLCDILSSAQKTPARRHYLTVIQPFIYYSFALASQPDNDFINNLQKMMDKDLVMVEGYAGIELLRANYPDIQIVTVKTPRQGLKMVLANYVPFS